MAEEHNRPETMDEGDVIELLQAQHGMIRNLFDEVEQASADRRAEAFTWLVRLLAVHETAEEDRPPVRPWRVRGRRRRRRRPSGRGARG
ncbi:hemerythrin domain-containing protein [Nonomuraea wenchangensis]